MNTNGYVWHFSQNQLDNATRNSYKAMNLLSADHNSKLAAEAQTGEQLFIDLYETFKPARKTYNNDYVNWLAAKAMYKAQTMRLVLGFELLTDKKIPKWDADIQAVFIERSPEYVAIFPGGRTDYRKGAYDTRLSRLNRMFVIVDKHEALKKTAQEIEEYYNTLNDIRELQQANEGDVKRTSELLEESRIETARIMYENLGKLMSHFSSKPEKIQRFFDMEIISSKVKITDDDPIIVAEGKVEPESKETIDTLTGKFVAETELIIHNTGDTAIEVYTTKLPDDPVPGTTLTIEPEKIAIATCGELGAEENLYLIIFNPSIEKTADYSVGVNHYGINQEEIK